MKKLIVLLIVCMCCVMFANAQKATIKGVITDTTNKENLSNAVIALLRSKDSVLTIFTRSKATGEFEISKLSSGNYLLMVTFPQFADYFDKIELTDTSHIDLGNVRMTLMANLLKEVIVQQQIAAIRMRGDTLEFKADSFKVREGASVEEMLKKLPGIQVDKDGKITAQGEKVEKVLVDGEEFFGDDPTIATKNIQADAIDKVQVFDKKSDQATFTGIDDGQKTKTINLKLKDDKKKGYFGKIDLGGGLNDRWNNSAMINNFRAKRKLSAYGIMSSTGTTGLNWQENNQYGSGSNFEYDDDFGGFYFNSGDDEFNNSNYRGQGLPKSWNGGLQYSNKFNDDKQSINGSYRYNKLNSEGSGSTFSQSILPDTLFFNTEKSKAFSSRQRHSLSGIYEWQIDSSASVKFTASGYTGTQTSLTDYTTEALNEDSLAVNKSARTTIADATNQNWKATLLLRKKFKKPGRTIALNIDQQFTKNKSDGYLNSINNFFDQGNLTGSDSTNQRKLNDNQISVLNSKLTYTEPLAKNVFAEINYALRVNNSNAERLSYDKGLDNKYAALNDTFSNNYKFNVLTNTGGLSLKYNGKKITMSAGTDVAQSNFKQTDQLNDSAIERNYTNFFPRGNFVYKFNQFSRLSLNYNGSTRQPSIQQIQPVRDNSNPLIQVVGNPFLKQEFTHRINFNFNSYKVFNQRGIYSYGSFSSTSNAIVQSNTTNDSAITLLQYINTNGNYNAYMGVGYNMKLKKLDMYINFGVNLDASRYNNIVNHIKNQTDNSSQGINFGFGKDKEKKYNFYYYGNISYNVSKSSIRPELKTNYLTQSHNLNLTVTLPWKLEVNSEVQGEFRQKTSLFDQNNNVVLWNAYLGRKLLKNDKAMIKISGYDMLNQNKGYNRYINSNVLREENYQTISRYFLLSFVWNFSKNPAGVAP